MCSSDLGDESRPDQCCYEETVLAEDLENSAVRIDGLVCDVGHPVAPHRVLEHARPDAEPEGRQEHPDGVHVELQPVGSRPLERVEDAVLHSDFL